MVLSFVFFALATPRQVGGLLARYLLNRDGHHTWTPTNVFIVDFILCRIPKSDPARRSSLFHMPPQRERASSLGNHLKSHDSQSDGGPVSSSGKLLFKEAVLKQSKVKQSERKQNNPATHKSTEGGGCGDENRLSNQETASPENDRADTPLPRQHQRRKKSVRPRKYASSDGMPSPAHGNSAEFYLNPNYLFSEVGDVDLARAEGARQQPQRREQQLYPRATRAAQLMHPLSPLYSRYLAEEQFHRYCKFVACAVECSN